MRHPEKALRSGKLQRGFSLVEIALVLVITGFVLGASLVGREMIVNSKMKKIEKDSAALAAAMFSYQDRFLRWPGDDEYASTRFKLYNDGTNDPAPTDINGNGDGEIDGSWLIAANAESANFWKHLRAAELLPGSGDDHSQPINAYGGRIGIRKGSLLIPGHTMIFGSIDGAASKRIERRLDDGAADAGRIQSDVDASLMDGSIASSAGARYANSSRYFMAFSI